MPRRTATRIAAIAMLAFGAGPVVDTASAAPDPPQGVSADSFVEHDMPNELEQERRKLRQDAISGMLSGEITAEKRGGSAVARVDAVPGAVSAAGGEAAAHVEVAREGTDRIFVVLAEFGNERHPSYPDRDTDPRWPGPVRFDGPLHNEIPAPDRSTDNSTIWQPDYSREHFEDLYFGDGESVKTYYEGQSAGRYSVEGTVTDWVKLKYNEARYGRCQGGTICTNSWALVADALAHWVDVQVNAGRSMEQIRAEVAQYDVWDRYDFDRDGEFNEPDGYLDRFAVVHAGGDKSDIDPWQGEDAIWSHRWYAYGNLAVGPEGNKRGGTPVGTTGLWVGDYTVQPENGGLGVFVHEYGHDLGLPDHYDTTRPSDDRENGVNWWSLMGQSRFSADGEAVGSRAGDLSAWDKLQLGWFDHDTVRAGEERQIDLGSHELQTEKPQGVVVVLPDKDKRVHPEPSDGDYMYWSGTGNNLDNTASVDIDLRGKSAATLNFKARYDIEGAFDFLYVQASTDGGATWVALDGTVNYPWNPFPRDRDGTPALHGSSGGFWINIDVPLSSLAGQEFKLRFRYKTNQSVALRGFFADEFAVTADGERVFSDGAEGSTDHWTFNGFQKTNGLQAFDQFYIASYRTYTGFGQHSKNGPFNFGFTQRPRFAEHFAYQSGLLVSYWDTSHTTNNSSAHHGEGLILPIDANPEPLARTTGGHWRPRVGGYDAPFSLEQSDALTLHHEDEEHVIEGRPAQPLFDDLRSYWSPEQPTAGVKVAAAGVGISVLGQTDNEMTVRVFSTR